jgi:hypothetical protein
MSLCRHLIKEMVEMGVHFNFGAKFPHPRPLPASGRGVRGDWGFRGILMPRNPQSPLAFSTISLISYFGGMWGGEALKQD